MYTLIKYSKESSNSSSSRSEETKPKEPKPKVKKTYLGGSKKFLGIIPIPKVIEKTENVSRDTTVYYKHPMTKENKTLKPGEADFYVSDSADETSQLGWNHVYGYSEKIYDKQTNELVPVKTEVKSSAVKSFAGQFGLAVSLGVAKEEFKQFRDSETSSHFSNLNSISYDPSDFSPEQQVVQYNNNPNFANQYESYRKY